MEKEIALKYGCNPNQQPAKIFMEEGTLPLRVLNGRPGYINFLDALNGWQLVQELRAASGLPAAASFKHTSPAGAALGLPLSEELAGAYFVPFKGLSALASAYARARGADRVSSYGDWAALSEPCDEETALLLKPEVSDGVIAPGYTPKALEILRAKRRGSYNIVEIDPAYTPQENETKQVFGISFAQRRNDSAITPALLQNIVTENKTWAPGAERDILLALITAKYTQSNSVCYAQGGQVVGVGAGQQSRIHCTRLAGDKADRWLLRQHPLVLGLPFLPGLARPEKDNAIDCYLSDYEGRLLMEEGRWQAFFSKKPAPFTAEEKEACLRRATGLALSSDAFFPFGDNIERAARSGVRFVAQPGGSVRDDDVIAACNRYGLLMCFTGLRLFHH